MSAHTLKLQLRLRFGLAPTEPTDFQLQAIANDLFAGATDRDLDAAVERHCDTYQTHVYAGATTSDLQDAIDELLDNYKK